MGNSHAKPMKDRAVHREKKIRENIVRAQQATEKRVQQQHTTAITQHDFQEFAILQTVQKQVERGDKPLNKNDLVAILIRLQPEHVKNLQAIQQTLTMKDLIAIIRGIIYNTDTITTNNNTITFSSEKDNTLLRLH